jgi:hypothetical protein
MPPEPSRDPASRGTGRRLGSVTPPPRARRYSTFVGVAFLALIIVATVNTIQTGPNKILGSSDVRGQPLTEFAVPDIRSDLVGDANVYQDDCATSRNPCPADQQRTPACRVRTPGALRVCDYFDRPLVLSFWFTRGADCLATQDLVDRVSRRYRGRVNFLLVDVRDARDEVRGIVSEHHWRVPVGWDRDGAVSDIYSVGVCPTVAFVYPGGIFQDATLGAPNLTRAKLTGAIDRLLRESRRRAAASR